MKKFYVVTFLLITITVILQVIQVYLANKVSSESVEMVAKQRLISRYEEENDRLRLEVLQNSNLQMIASKAATLGFLDPQEAISLYDPLELAASHEEQ